MSPAKTTGIGIVDDGWHTDKNGNKFCYKNNQLHNEYGPALIRPTGAMEYYRHGLLHREDGPAVITAHGSKLYYQKGKMHRDDGPSSIHSDGTPGLGYTYAGNVVRKDSVIYKMIKAKEEKRLRSEK